MTEYKPMVITKSECEFKTKNQFEIVKITLNIFIFATGFICGIYFYHDFLVKTG